MTKKIYLSDTYLFTDTAKVIDIKEIPEIGIAVILDQTIFYPQGGGQPADQGEIKNNEGTFNVTNTKLNPDGIILHFGEFTSGQLEKGQSVTLSINAERRTLNARNHSAGHFIDMTLEKLNITDLQPKKGFHFPDGPYVEYQGVVSDNDQLFEILQAKINELQNLDIPVIIEELSYQEAQEKSIWAPEGKSARIVKFKDSKGCGCGGTHVESNQEIGSINLKKIKSKKGHTKISYTIN